MAKIHLSKKELKRMLKRYELANHNVLKSMEYQHNRFVVEVEMVKKIIACGEVLVGELDDISQEKYRVETNKWDVLVGEYNDARWAP